MPPGSIPAFPPPHPNDSEDVGLALCTAAAFWRRGQFAEGAQYVQKAAGLAVAERTKAGRTDSDIRVVELAMAANDLAHFVEAWSKGGADADPSSIQVSVEYPSVPILVDSDTNSTPSVEIMSRDIVTESRAPASPKGRPPLPPTKPPAGRTPRQNYTMPEMERLKFPDPPPAADKPTTPMAPRPRGLTGTLADGSVDSGASPVLSPKPAVPRPVLGIKVGRPALRKDETISTGSAPAAAVTDAIKQLHTEPSLDVIDRLPSQPRDTPRDSPRESPRESPRDMARAIANETPIELPALVIDFGSDSNPALSDPFREETATMSLPISSDREAAAEKGGAYEEAATTRRQEDVPTRRIQEDEEYPPADLDGARSSEQSSKK